MSEFARGFRIVWPDGHYLDGARFPSGRCVIDDPNFGLMEAAIGLEYLTVIRNLAKTGAVRIEWPDVALHGADLGATSPGAENPAASAG